MLLGGEMGSWFERERCGGATGNSRDYLVAVAVDSTDQTAKSTEWLWNSLAVCACVAAFGAIERREITHDDDLENGQRETGLQSSEWWCVFEGSGRRSGSRIIGSQIHESDEQREAI